MISRNKRLVISGTVTLSFFLVIVLLPIFNIKIQGNSNENFSSTHQIASVSVIRKSTPPKTILPVKNKPKKSEFIQKEEIVPENKADDIVETDYSEQSEENNAEISETEGFLENSVVSEIEKNAITSYKKYVLSRIASKKVYPIAARTKGQTGRVKMFIQINKDGSLKTVAIVKKSQFDLLNEASVIAVKKSAPFKKIPPEISGGIDMKFSMDFLLNN